MVSLKAAKPRSVHSARSQAIHAAVLAVAIAATAPSARAQFAVYGAIGEKYAALGGQNGVLGPAATDELPADFGGRYNQFRNGFILWHPQTGAGAVWGLIGQKYNAMGRVGFGYPITDELATPDGQGRFNHFRKLHEPGKPETSIYWSPRTGAFAVYGQIRTTWAGQGWERGPLGYPTSDEFQAGQQRRQNFEGGHITWTAQGGARVTNTQRTGTTGGSNVHTVSLRVSRWVQNDWTRSFSDVPVIGTFTGRGTDCSRGYVRPLTSSPGSGAGVFNDVGWGQVEGSGRPGANSDQCVSWVHRLGVDFDLGPYNAVAGAKVIERAILRYNEAETPLNACYALVYTQGGLATDFLPCWTNGQGARENKPDGCVVLRVPSADWATTRTRPGPLLNRNFPKVGRGRWDVTDLFRERLSPGLMAPPELGGSNQSGWGYALVGGFTDTAQLDANDNTRCESRVTDIALEVTFSVRPSGPSPIVR